MRTLCLDFDGVIHGYQSGWRGATTIPDPPVPGALAFIVGATKQFSVAIFSSRSGQDGGIPAMKRWLGHHLIAHEPILVPSEHVWSWVENELQWPVSKPAAFVTLDDRAIRFTGSWPSYDELNGFKTWQQP